MNTHSLLVMLEWQETRSSIRIRHTLKCVRIKVKGTKCVSKSNDDFQQQQLPKHCHDMTWTKVSLWKGIVVFAFFLTYVSCIHFCFQSLWQQEQVTYHTTLILIWHTDWERKAWLRGHHTIQLVNWFLSASQSIISWKDSNEKANNSRKSIPWCIFSEWMVIEKNIEPVFYASEKYVI